MSTGCFVVSFLLLVNNPVFYILVFLPESINSFSLYLQKADYIQNQRRIGLEGRLTAVFSRVCFFLCFS